MDNKKQDLMNNKNNIFRKKRAMEHIAFVLSIFLLTVSIPIESFAETNQNPPLTYQDVDFDFTDLEQMPGSAEGGDEAAFFSLAAESEGTLPIAYNINKDGNITDNLPSMKNQGSYGNCWAFSALGASEANLMKKGYADRSIDLSERHLTYYFYKKGADTADRLFGTLGDYNTISNQASDYWNIGGNSLLTIWHMASWCGPVLEEVAPFSASMKREDQNGLLGQTNSTQMAYESDAFHLENAYVIPIGDSYRDVTQRNQVKKLIMEYGALGMSYYSQKTVGGFDNVQNDCYYNDTYTSTNHAIQVVGWDDRFSKENFNVGHRPEADGAWLMKNSWGDENDTLAQNGYFWMSYYDYSLRNASGSTTKYAYVYDCGPADNYDQIYQHDGEAGHKRFGNESGSYYGLAKAANVFSVSSKQEMEEYLEAVSIGESREGIPYTLSIYTELGENGPTDGVLALSQTGVIKYNGYHTIPLQRSIKLERGTKYSIVFEFKDTAYVYASRSFTLSPWKFVSKNTQGQSYFMLSTSQKWEDCADNSLTNPQALRIKGFTRYAKTPVFSDDQITMSSAGQTSIVSVMTLSENATKADLDAQNAIDAASNLIVPEYASVSSSDMLYEWDSSDENVALVSPCEGENGRSARIEAVGDGVCRITAKLLSDSQMSRDIYVRVGERDIDEYCIWQAESTSEPGTDPDKPADTPDSGDKPSDTGNEPNNNQTDEEELLERPAILTGLALNQKKVQLTVGKKIQLVADPIYSDGKKNEWKVYWKSTDASVASVSASGQVSAKKIGKCAIEVYNGNVSARCEVVVVPMQTSGVRLQLIDGEKVKIAFQSVKGADGYQVYRAKTSDGTYKRVKTITSVNNASLLTKGFYNQNGQKKAYYFKVRAMKKLDGVKYYGAFSSAKSLEPAKSKIVNIKKISAKAVKIRFAKVKNADGYRIYRRKKADQKYEVIGVVSRTDKTEFVDKTVRRGNRYYYKVRAFRLVAGKRIYGPKSYAKKMSF